MKIPYFPLPLSNELNEHRGAVNSKLTKRSKK